MESLYLGQTKKGRKVFIDQKIRSTHMQIIGSSGEGKSKFMEHMIRQDILDRNGLCLIDPHGYLYNDIVRWCTGKRLLEGRKPHNIILFDPSEENWTFGFNPLDVGSSDASYIPYHVDAMVKAVAKVWGGENADKTPLLKRCLRVLFHALAEKKLSLLEAQYLIDRVDKTVRSYLTCDIKSSIVRQEWEYFNTLTPRQFYDEFGSTINRMVEFLHAPSICNVIGQTSNTINFREIMDEGRIFLVNLASADRISEDNARLLGTLIVNDLFMKAKGRKKGSRPFYLYIDECALFINEDIKRILDEGRKFGLHLILAHQHLAQLKKVGEDIYHAVMTDAKTKVIFGGLNAEDARVMAENVFMGELDLEEAKTKLNKPVVVGYVRTWLENYSQGKSFSRGRTEGSSTGGGDACGETSGIGNSVSVGYYDGAEGKSSTATTGSSNSSNRVSSSNWSENKSTTETETESSSHGRSEAMQPILQEMPSQVFNLEEQIYKVMSLMVNQPMQHAIIKLPKKKPRLVKTPTVNDEFPKEERIESFKFECYGMSSFINTKSSIEEQIRERHAVIEYEANRFSKPMKSGSNNAEDGKSGGAEENKEDFYE